MFPSSDSLAHRADFRSDPLSRSIIAISLFLIVTACGASEPPPDQVAEAYLQELIEREGELGDLAMSGCSKELHAMSQTEIPAIDWDKVSAVSIDGYRSRGPGRAHSGSPDDVSIASVKYGSITYGNLISIQVRFTLTTEDGGAHSGMLSLRPVDGVLKILPRRQASG